MPSQPNDPPRPPAEDAGPETLAGWSDAARFDLVVNEERIGTIRSVWTPDGGFESDSRLTVAGQTIEASVRIRPDERGRWREIRVRTVDGVRTSTRTGLTVERVYRGQTEQRTTFEIVPGALVFDPEAVALMSQAFRRYDETRGGVQPFSVSIGGRPPVPLAVEALGKEQRAVGGNPLEIRRFRYGIPGTDLFATTDRDLRVLVAELPAHATVLVREGYAEIGPGGHDPGVSAPAFEVSVERKVGIPMRDGTVLAADVYRPVGLERAPVVLARTPYGKGTAELQARFYARRGYAFVVQDCRGTGDSPGEWEPLVHEGRDGFDTIEWLGLTAWSTGRVGMIGGSYLALAQWLAAVERPPHLKAMIPNVSPTDPFHNFPYESGIFGLLGTLWWLEVIDKHAAADLSGVALRAISQTRLAERLGSLPVVDLDRAAFGKESPAWRRWIAHPTSDDYWRPAEFVARLDQVAIPVFHQSGWFDDNGVGTKRNYLAMVAHRHPNQKLVLGPWGHTDTATRVTGDTDFGAVAIVDLQREYLRWFDRWLKDADNGIDREPPVSLFVMGANRWIHTSSYPVPDARTERVYLQGDGGLSFEPPPADSPADRYRYDPADPTPDWRVPGPADVGASDSPDESRRVRTLARERRATRSDILCYETAPLTEPLTVVGPIGAVLYASTSAADTDWFVTVFEVRADGVVARLVQGKLRARYRTSVEHPTLLEPDRVYRFELDLWHIGVQLAPGSRIKVEITSAAFPLFSRNLNTGGHNETETEFVPAWQTIYHDQERPSHLTLLRV